MTYYERIASLFALPGLPPGACFAAGLAITARHLVKEKVVLRYPALFRPDLTSALTIFCLMDLGRTRFLNAVEYFLQRGKPFPSNRTFRSLDAISFWELSLGKISSARAIRNKASELEWSTFDCGDPASARAALVVGQPAAFENYDDELCNLSARAVYVDAVADSPGTLRDVEPAEHAQGQLLQFLAWLRKMPHLGFTAEAEVELGRIPDGPEWELRHCPVKTAKLSALFAVVRCAMDGWGELLTSEELITKADVSAAREMVFAQADTALQNAAVKEENDFLQRLLETFSGPEPQEVPLATIQTRIRKSRREGARTPAALIQALVLREDLQIVTGTRCGPTNGRAARSVIIPSLPAPLPSQNPVGLLPPASADCSTK